jgi:adenylate cyclase
VHIIDIDEAALDTYGQWPWPRSYMAALNDRLFDHGAAAVGYDILFAEPDRTSPERITESWSRFREGIPPVLPDLGLPAHDQLFAASIEGRAVVLSVAGGQEGEVPVPRAGVAVTGDVPPGLIGYPAAVVNLPVLTAAAAGIGTISLGRSADGVTRTVPLVSRIARRSCPPCRWSCCAWRKGRGAMSCAPPKPRARFRAARWPPWPCRPAR